MSNQMSAGQAAKSNPNLVPVKTKKQKPAPITKNEENYGKMVAKPNMKRQPTSAIEEEIGESMPTTSQGSKKQSSKNRVSDEIGESFPTSSEHTKK